MNAHADQQLPNRSASKATAEPVPEAAPVSVSPSYAEGRLAQALRTSVLHEDTATRERARSRAQQWRQVLSGISSGSLTIGSRTPVAALPPG